MIRWAVGLTVLSMSAGMLGCAAAPAVDAGCKYYTSFGVTPSSATADHSATSPGNQQQFKAVEGPAGTGTGCILAAHSLLVYPNWTSSDPMDVSVNSAKDETNGTAVCTGSTGSPVMLTATSTDVTAPQSASVQMSCK